MRKAEAFWFLEYTVWRNTSVCPDEKLFLLMTAYTLLAIESLSVVLTVSIVFVVECGRSALDTGQSTSHTPCLLSSV